MKSFKKFTQYNETIAENIQMLKEIEEEFRAERMMLSEIPKDWDSWSLEMQKKYNQDHEVTHPITAKKDDGEGAEGDGKGKEPKEGEGAEGDGKGKEPKEGEGAEGDGKGKEPKEGEGAEGDENTDTDDDEEKKKREEKKAELKKQIENTAKELGVDKEVLTKELQNEEVQKILNDKGFSEVMQNFDEKQQKELATAAKAFKDIGDNEDFKKLQSGEMSYDDFKKTKIGQDIDNLSAGQVSALSILGEIDQIEKGNKEPKTDNKDNKNKGTTKKNENEEPSGAPPTNAKDLLSDKKGVAKFLGGVALMASTPLLGTLSTPLFILGALLGGAGAIQSLMPAVGGFFKKLTGADKREAEAEAERKKKAKAEKEKKDAAANGDNPDANNTPTNGKGKEPKEGEGAEGDGKGKEPKEGEGAEGDGKGKEPKEGEGAEGDGDEPTGDATAAQKKKDDEEEKKRKKQQNNQEEGYRPLVTVINDIYKGR